MRSLSDYTQTKESALFKELGAFYAFSESQFEESKVDGVKYATLGNGLIVPADNVSAVAEGGVLVSLRNLLSKTLKKTVSQELFVVNCLIRSVFIQVIFLGLSAIFRLMASQRKRY